MMLLIWSLALPFPTLADDRTVEQRFRREYPAAAERLEAMTRSLTAKGTLFTRNYDGKETRAEVSLARRPGYYLYIRTKPLVVSGIKLESTMVMCQTPTRW
jgi:hypothetical protein